VAAAKKKSRKELLKEPDAVLTWSSRLFGLATQHKDAVFYSLIGLLLVAALFSGYRLYASREEAKAAVLLEEALAKYERLKKDQPQAKAVQGVPTGPTEALPGLLTPTCATRLATSPRPPSITRPP
jgi:hypothetical protein